jgi:hypothetical protein
MYVDGLSSVVFCTASLAGSVWNASVPWRNTQPCSRAACRRAVVRLQLAAVKRAGCILC